MTQGAFHLALWRNSQIVEMQTGDNTEQCAKQHAERNNSQTSRGESSRPEMNEARRAGEGETMR